jgi:hypothetical protein
VNDLPDMNSLQDFSENQNQIKDDQGTLGQANRTPIFKIGEKQCLNCSGESST